MATIYVDPSYATNGAGTFADPRNIVPTSVAYGDFVLFKERTIRSGQWAIPVPSGTGSPTNVLTLGTYDAITGLQIYDKTRAAEIRPTSSSQDAILINAGRHYITIDCLKVTGTAFGPTAGIRALDSNYITIRNCVVEGALTGVSNYGIRMEVVNGGTASFGNWTIDNCDISQTANSAILIIWSSASGGFAYNITVKNNNITNLLVSASGTSDGINIMARSTDASADVAGLTGKGVYCANNVIRNTTGFGIRLNGITSNNQIRNICENNSLYNIGNGDYDMHCIWLGMSSDWIIQDNTIDTSTAYRSGSTGSGVGIFIDSPPTDPNGCDRVVCRRNIIRNVGQGAASTNVELGGAGIFVLKSSDILIEQNLVLDSTNGIIVWGGTAVANISARVTLRNNTVLRSLGSNYIVCQRADFVSMLCNLSVGSLRGFYTETTGADPITNYTETSNIEYQGVLGWCTGNMPDSSTPTITSRTPSGVNQTINPQIASNGVPNPGSPLFSGTVDLGYLKDVEGNKGRKYIGAFAQPFTRNIR